MLKVGMSAPEIVVATSTNAPVSLKALRGKKVVLYFYPKDMTPGCTQEACDFRDNMARLQGRGVFVIGVSSDSVGSHARFKEKFDLPFELLSDPDFALAKTYGAYGDKMLYGQKVVGTLRSTFLIDERGKIARVWSQVKVEGHVAEVLSAIRELDSAGRSGSSTPRSGRNPTSRRRAARGHRGAGAQPTH